MFLKDREDAGKRLAALLTEYSGQGTVVYAIPRGGVILGAVIAKELHTELDLIVPRKIGHPKNPEYAVCAVTEAGLPVFGEREQQFAGTRWLKEEIRKAQVEIQRRREQYLGKSYKGAILAKTAILVDDGIATGLTMMAAIVGIKALNPAKLVVAVPVLPYAAAKMIEPQVDKVIALLVEKRFVRAVSEYYEDFSQVDDDEVKKAIEWAATSSVAARAIGI